MLSRVRGAAIIVIRVSLPVPLRRSFDYEHSSPLQLGVRVRVPFGRRVLTGLVIELPPVAAPGVVLRPILDVIDSEPLLTLEQLDLLRFAAEYYHHPLGEVLFAALPPALRQGRVQAPPKAYCLTEAGAARGDGLSSRAPRQAALWSALRAAGALSDRDLKRLGPGMRPALRALMAAGLVVECRSTAEGTPAPQDRVELRPDQQAAYEAIGAALGRFQPFLLFGVTGSGKTEVYLKLIADVAARGQQALVLVPEIGLTPQLVARFESRLAGRLGVLHSGCTPSARLRVWSQAREGRIAVVVGTRSAVFVPLRNLGLVVIDEEHDGSFKQQDGFRYHARDMAVVRAQRSRVPIILGSATPSLETYRHALEGRYRLLRLPDRGPGQGLPLVQFVDLGREPGRGGLSARLLEAVRDRLERREQALLFLNRRGYAPVLLCPECRWHAPCERCDARLTVHAVRQHLRCHHCGHERPIPVVCPRCHHPKLLRVGEGTQRVEEMLRQTLPEARVARIDRDTVTHRSALEELLRKVREHEVDILVGTQMMAKGHDFKDLTLVGVIHADQGLHGTDFRADEQLFAQIVQVAGRAGRAHKPGEVIIQTYHPTHPLWAPLARLDYETFAGLALKDREETQFPPYAHCALLRAEALKPELPARFLEAARALRPESAHITLGSVLPATLARRAGYYRAQLLVTSRRRSALQVWLKEWIPRFSESPAAAGVRWSLDVDPHSLF